MSIILYGRGQSRSFRGLWALCEAELEFTYQEVSPQAMPENYSNLNPQSKVPTLLGDKLCLTESAAIVNYVSMMAPEKGLIPTGVNARAEYDDICYFIMTELEQPLWTIGKHRFALPEEHRHEVIFRTANFEFRKAQDALSHHLQDREFAIGASFTMADILLAHTFNWAIRFNMEVDQQFCDYRDKHYERAACKRSLSMVSPK